MSTPQGAIDINALDHQFQTIKDAERDRLEFEDGLLRQIRTLCLEREEHVKELRAKKLLAETYQDRFEAAEKRINELERAIDCDKFVSVVIDGDNSLFQDDYIKDGLVGGERAAKNLQQALFEYFKDKEYFKNDYKIVVKIYLDLVNLSRTYKDVGIIHDLGLLQRFVQGFNKTNSLMEVIDAGNGKQGADSKVKAEFDLFRRNLQCKQIVLSGSGDGGYGGLLQPHAPNSGKSEKITLIEALPFARDLQFLADKFDTVSFVDIFRSTKVVRHGSSTHENLARTPTPPAKSGSAPRAQATPPATYATTVLKASAAPVSDYTDVSRATTQEKRIRVNSIGQRVDVPLKNLRKDLIFALKQRKLCNRHHLGNHCEYGISCAHSHNDTLNETQLENLRYVARFSPCDSGLGCRDPDCYAGHRCQQGLKCINLANGKCWFSNEMHRVDTSNTTIVSPAA